MTAGKLDQLADGRRRREHGPRSNRRSQPARRERARDRARTNTARASTSDRVQRLSSIPRPRSRGVGHSSSNSLPAIGLGARAQQASAEIRRRGDLGPDPLAQVLTPGSAVQILIAARSLRLGDQLRPSRSAELERRLRGRGSPRRTETASRPHGARASRPEPPPSRRSPSGRIRGTTSNPRVNSSAPWTIRAKPADHDVGDPMALERSEQPERIKLRLRHRLGGGGRRCTRRSGESIRFLPSRSARPGSYDPTPTKDRNRRARTSEMSVPTLGATAPAPTARSPNNPCASACRQLPSGAPGAASPP